MEYHAYSFPEFPFDMLIIYHISITKNVIKWESFI